MGMVGHGGRAQVAATCRLCNSYCIRALSTDPVEARAIELSSEGQVCNSWCQLLGSLWPLGYKPNEPFLPEKDAISISKHR